VERYNKPIFVSAGNSQPGLNAYSEISSGDKVISVGGYVHEDTWRAVFGAKAFGGDYINNSAGRGPREDGGFKPDLIAPSAGVFATRGWGPGEHFTKAYKLPPGYATNQGTSFSAPMAAGAAALLISAAKQTGAPYDAARLRWALKAGARYLPRYGAHEQGAGLINVIAAWEALKNPPQTPDIICHAPNKTLSSQYLKKPYHGPGIYEREGWSSGQTGHRTITFTRTTGPVEPVVYPVIWIGNDGTFDSQTTIKLPLLRPVDLQVLVYPKSSGVHSAILSLVDAKTGYSIHQVMNTVVAAEQLTAEKHFTAKWSGQVEWLGYKSYFINIPIGTSALKVDLEIKHGNISLQFPTRPTGKYATLEPNRAGVDPAHIIINSKLEERCGKFSPIPLPGFGN